MNRHDPKHKDEIFDKFLSIIKSNNYKNILDIGPGDGIESKKLLDNGFNVIAVGADCNNKIKQLSKDYNNFLFVNFDLNYGIPLNSFLEEGFDGIWMSHCLEHLNNPFDFLQTCHENLKESGILCVIVPEYKDLIVDQHIFTGWNVGHLMNLLFRTGFNIKDGKYRTAGYNVAAIVKKDSNKEIIGSCGNTINIDPIWLRKYADNFPESIKKEIIRNGSETSFFNGAIGSLNW